MPRVAIFSLVLFAGSLMTETVSIAADGPAPIRYTVRFPDPRTHYAEIEAIVPTDGAPKVELMMAVWMPGSYLVREFARNVEDFHAKSSDGKDLKWEKTRKNRWGIETEGADSISVSYRVYCREQSVQTNFVEASFALINGGPTFMTLPAGLNRPHEVTIVPAEGWLKSTTGLPDASDGKPHHYVAPDFDTLVDCPIHVGNPATYEFEVDGKPHILLNDGEQGVWDGPRSAKDVEAIVRAERDFWGFLPYEKYVFFNLLTETGGGLEHKNSTVLMASRWATRTRQAYLSWLGLVAHEYFHTWNVKRLRPVELGPFDYENEVYTKSLWIAEGLTSYYDRLFVRRAGLCTDKEFFAGDPTSASDEKLIGDIERLQTTPGRLAQPLETASYDSWIKFYRRDENTNNTAISYYTKGAVVGFLLDAKIRKATGGKKSLDDVMRLAYERFSGEKGYTPAEFRAVASEVAGIDLQDFFVRALESTDELDYAEALDVFGLQFAPGNEKKEKDGKEPAPPKAWLGLTTKTENGSLVVTALKRDTPGYDAGFNVGDEIVAIGDERVRADNWGKRMEQFRPKEHVSILIARRDHLMKLDATFGVEPPRTWKLEPLKKPSEAQKEQMKSWLEGD
jgi:predicted metalloprotease with PDZ domain